MKFDKETSIALIICGIILFGWEPLCKHMGWFQVPVPEVAAEAPEVSTPAPAQTAPQVAAVRAKVQTPPSAAVQPKISAPAAQPVQLSNSDLKLTIDPASGMVTNFTLLQHKTSDFKSPVELPQKSGETFGWFSNQKWETLNISKSQLDGHKYTLMRDLRNAAGVTFTLLQSWQLPESGYTVKCQAVFLNRTQAPIALAPIYFGGGELASWQVISGDKVRVPSHRMDVMTEAGSFKDIDADDDEDDFFRKFSTVDWAGVSNKYFALLLDAPQPFGLYQQRDFITVKGKDDKQPVIRTGAAFEPLTLQPGVGEKFELNCYAGPKIADELAKFNPNASRVMHLSWGPLDYLARFLLWILVKLESVCGSYGWSIILLTLIVRFLFYPATLKANASMQKMKVVQPKIKALRDQYKDNPQLLNQKMMELYRQEGVNPLGGCLPILLQLPVFFALYSTLDGAVQLRQVPFYWCTDLAAADTVCRIPLHWFELPINPLVLAMTGLMVLQQHLTPMAMDPMQKKMMTLMPVIMLVLLYDLPSGLTLYWTVSNLFSIIQLLLQNRSRAKAEAAAGSAAAK